MASSQQEFDTVKGTYDEALRKAGYNGELRYKTAEGAPERRGKNRKRNCLWFNPPYSLGIQGNITKMFYSIVSRAFPRDHEYLGKLFNSRNLKVSYSTTPNLQSILAKHNKKVMAEYESKLQPKPRSCNCRDKNSCPLDNKCLTESIVYRADVQTRGNVIESRFYIGLTCNSFKSRHAGHKSSFTKERYRDQTSLSSYIWELKEKGIEFDIMWSIVRQVGAHKPGEKICALCLAEKMEILKGSGDKNCLNKRSELFSKCRHKNQNVLASLNR